MAEQLQKMTLTAQTDPVPQQSDMDRLEQVKPSQWKAKEVQMSLIGKMTLWLESFLELFTICFVD
jgi:hypothetical protein